MEHGTPTELISRHIPDFGIHLTNKQTDQFAQYLHHLQAWNKRSNLTGITQDKEIVIKHFVDSLAALIALDVRKNARIMDVGTGAGFPGIPLKIVRPDLSITLVEPVQKKVTFLRFITGILAFDNVAIYCGTLNQFTSENTLMNSFDYVTTRALAHDVVLKESHVILNECGKCLLYLSRPISKSAISPDWSVVHEFRFELPSKLGQRVVSILERTHRS